MNHVSTSYVNGTTLASLCTPGHTEALKPREEVWDAVCHRRSLLTIADSLLIVGQSLCPYKCQPDWCSMTPRGLWIYHVIAYVSHPNGREKV